MDRNKESLKALFDTCENLMKTGGAEYERRKTECELCGKVKWCCTTSFHGDYCLECTRLEQYEDRQAVKAILNKQ